VKSEQCNVKRFGVTNGLTVKKRVEISMVSCQLETVRKQVLCSESRTEYCLHSHSKNSQKINS